MQYFLFFFFFYRLHHTELTQVGWKMLTFSWIWLILFLFFFNFCSLTSVLWIFSICVVTSIWVVLSWSGEQLLLLYVKYMLTGIQLNVQNHQGCLASFFQLTDTLKNSFLFSLIPLMDVNFQPNADLSFKAAENWWKICMIWTQISALTTRQYVCSWCGFYWIKTVFFFVLSHWSVKILMI